MNKDLIAIFEYLEREKGIKRETIISALEESLIISAKKSFQNVGTPSVKIDTKTGDIEVTTQKTIVETVEDPNEEILLEEAKKLAPDCKVGQILEIFLSPKEFGRIAAQTARQVIAQKLKEAEKKIIQEEYKHRINEIISGKIKRFFRGRNIVVDLGKVEAIMPEYNYPRTEKYQIGERVIALLLEVRDTDTSGAEVILSRSNEKFISALFYQEVPEIADGIITIEKIAREPGYRTKMAVSSQDPKIDPVGTCVGVKGTRIKNIIRELNNEKIDVIPYSQDELEFLKYVLFPLEPVKCKIKKDKIMVAINDEDYPIIIGKKGMNARLISKLLEKECTFQKISEYQKLLRVRAAELSESGLDFLNTPVKDLKNISNLILEELISFGLDTIKKVLEMPEEEIEKSIPGINYLDLIDKILEEQTS